tara:strand:+ start:96 stop:701 length:606 start_codon:yes stop_codon:yes gene_type:complete
MKLDQYFPTVIGMEDWKEIDKYKEEYIKLIDKAEKKPGGNIYYPFHTDDRFKPLINFVEENANIYAKAHKYPDYYKIYESWAIDYPPKTNQPFHAHDGSIITCLFYLDVDENDTGTIFKSPYYVDDQNPLNVNIYSAVEDSIYNEFTFKTIQYKPKPGRLLVWRSFVEHATHPKEDNGKKRIILSFNLQREKCYLIFNQST